MGTSIDMTAFIARLKAHRGDLGLREAAQQIGIVSASTLSRIENGKIPDMDVYLRLCDWMGVEPQIFFTYDHDDKVDTDTPEAIEALLRADKDLDETTAEAIAKMVESAYRLNRRKADD